MTKESTYSSAIALARMESIRQLMRHRRKGLSAAEISKAIGLSGSAVRGYLVVMRGESEQFPHEREIRISSWREVRGSKPCPLYYLGSKPDAKKIHAIPHSAVMRFTAPAAVAKMERMRAAIAGHRTRYEQGLELNPGLSGNDLEDGKKHKVHASSRRIREMLRYLRGIHPTAPNEKEIYICAWINKNHTPLYAPGNLPDVPQPRTDPRILDRRYYREKMKDPERKKRLRHQQKMASLRRAGKLGDLVQPEVAFMFGKRKPFDMEYYAAERPWPPVMLQLLVRNVMLEPRHVPRRQTQ